MMFDLISPFASEHTCVLDHPGPDRPEDAPARYRMLERMLDVVPHSMLLVTQAGHVLFANRTARCELDAQHPVHLLGRELRVRRTQDIAPLRDAIHRAATKGLQRLLRIGDPDRKAITVAIAPAGEPAGNQPGSAMLIFCKREVCEDLSADAFSRQFGLTGAEVRVLKQLCCGRSPAEIAIRQGVAISTVRTQIASIRIKTGVGDIATLVREVSLLPPLMSLMRAAA